jgi:hypothetical protein
MTRIYKLLERPLLAEDCLLPGHAEGPLTRKQMLKLNGLVAIYNPSRHLETKYQELLRAHCGF